MPPSRRLLGECVDRMRHRGSDPSIGMQVELHLGFYNIVETRYSSGTRGRPELRAENAFYKLVGFYGTVEPIRSTLDEGSGERVALEDVLVMANGAIPPVGRRVLALCEPGRGASTTLDLARELAEHESARLTVVNVAPQAATAGGQCCGMSVRDHNQVVRDAAAEELREAHARLGPIAEQVTFQMLVEGSDPPLHEWIADRDFDLVLLPARRRLIGAARHPEAARVRASTTAELRVVDPKARSARDVAHTSPSARRRASA
jgi:hypothetical protein